MAIPCLISQGNLRPSAGFLASVGGLSDLGLFLPAAVEGCVLHGLKRRAAGFLRSNKIAALFMKVGKSFPPAEELSRKVQGLEQLIEST